MSEEINSIDSTNVMSDAETGNDENISTESGAERIDLAAPEYEERFKTAEIYVRNHIINAIQITETGLEAGDYAAFDVQYDEQTGQFLIYTWGMHGEDADSKAVIKDVRVISPGEWLVTVPPAHSGDRVSHYPIPNEIFTKRYESTGEVGKFRIKGKSRIIKNPTGKKVVITAPWGGDQVGDEDCYFCASCDDETLETISKKNRFILSAKDFASYEPIPDIAETPEKENEKFGEALIGQALSGKNQ
jgi:hypothetical protein